MNQTKTKSIIGDKIVVGVLPHGGEKVAHGGKNLLLVVALEIQHFEVAVLFEEHSECFGIAFGCLAVHVCELLEGVQVQFLKFLRHEKWQIVLLLLRDIFGLDILGLGFGRLGLVVNDRANNLRGIGGGGVDGYIVVVDGVNLADIKDSVSHGFSEKKHG